MADRFDCIDRAAIGRDRWLDVAGVPLQPADLPFPSIDGIGQANLLRQEQRLARRQERLIVSILAFI